jgi:hypothetical protein
MVKIHLEAEGYVLKKVFVCDEEDICIQNNSDLKINFSCDVVKA